MGNLVGNSDGLPGVGQPAFPPFPNPPKGGGKGNGGPREIPSEVGSGKSEVGNFDVVRLLTTEELEDLDRQGGTTEEIANLLEVGARYLRRGNMDSAAWRVADAAALLAKKACFQGRHDVDGIHRRTGRGAAIYPPDPKQAFQPVPTGPRQKTALYRHFDASDRLLYVGISLSAVQRLAQHRTGAKWFDQIARVDVQWLPSREDALAAESEAIRTERPQHNIAGTSTRSPA